MRPEHEELHRDVRSSVEQEIHEYLAISGYAPDG